MKYFVYSALPQRIIYLTEVFLVLIFTNISSSVDITYDVEEGARKGTFIGDVAADTQLLNSFPHREHRLVTFNQLQPKTLTTTRLFNVSKNGKLYTAEVLDAETLCKYNTECFKMVEVAVQHEQSFVKILEIRLIINDINDNQPEFPVKQIDITFSEDDSKGLKRSIPNAIDKDVGLSNSEITYQLNKEFDDPFSLSVSKRVDGKANLDIKLEKKLDREQKDTYKLQVIAKDGGFPSRQSILDVFILVTDENDNIPTFSLNVYNVTVKNTYRRDKPVVTLTATDLDSGKNGEITYHFSSETPSAVRSMFELDEKTGGIFLTRNFSFGERKTYKLFIEATDQGNPPMSSDALVLVNIINQQNTAPSLDVKFVSGSKENTAAISEGVKVGSFIAYVKVLDNDVGMNSEVSCELHHDKLQLLSLGRKKYKVIVKNRIDRETESFIDFTIVCKDEGSPPQRTEGKFSVQVLDVNDIQPQFTKDTYKFLTYENEDPNFPIGFINATDLDLGDGGQLIYSLLAEDYSFLPFEISNFGFISTTKPLDFEQQDVYKFKVFVRDNGTPSLNNTAHVIVEVMDENDNAPYFTFPSVNPFSLDVYYNPQSENDITVLRSSDRDSHVNAFLRYEILGGNHKQLFTVNPYTGVLSFSRTVYQNDAGSYELSFIVKDSGSPILSATTTLSLTLTVSNTTSKMYSAEDTESDNRIHINLMIIIVMSTVIVAVAVVVSITVCIVRRNNQRNEQYNDGIDSSNRFLGESKQGDYICEQMSLQYEASVTMTSVDDNKSSQASLPRLETHSGYKTRQNWRDSSAKVDSRDLTQGTRQLLPTSPASKLLPA
ncbi:protocadherin-17 isoform X2 [Octopus bimaculoides]|uniref:protocadherin-17 isoform X2 n=1 Tax=Octopus bimaculoides TaxID=37653 RepID=UPI00071C46DC|nr:protocadherin-17 isoform X2 [Octopus bimaculoides]|eukprot:XP_014778547.1 PREDICTED: protocadherin-17-like isoform X2 [Octopus bimaculoides]